MLDNEKEAIVIDLFLTTHDNRVSVIAEKTGLHTQKVSTIINKYLSKINVNYDEL